MHCPRCQAENREGRRFCAECGASLALACPACGFSNEPGERFCGGCGVPLRPSPTVVQPKFGAPESYTPRHLTEKILSSKSALEGERKQVTVLFADLKGSTELLADRDPEEARKLLDPVLERMMEAVHRYEGTVNQVMGDGIMALFGARVAHEDHAVRACYAALDLQRGNPLFLEESVRSLADEGALVGDRGAYRLVTAPETVHVPATVQAILAARIDRLPPEDKHLLQTASVVGTNVPVVVLAAVAGGPADALAEGLGRLQAAELLYLRQAAGKAMGRSAYREAAAGFEQALDALAHLPASRERAEQAIDLHLDASGALMTTSGPAKSTEHVREAEALAVGLGDDRRLGQALSGFAIRAWMSGDSDRAIELHQRVLAIALGHEDPALRTSANTGLGVVWQTRGAYRQAAAYLAQTVQALQGDRLYERLGGGILASVFARDRLAWCLAELGEFTEAMARAEEAGRIAREVDHSRSLVYAYRSLGFVPFRRGDLTQAIPPLERAVELSRAIPAPLLFDVVAAHLGYAYALSGRLPEGVALLEEALADPATTGIANHSLLLAYLGEAHLLAGRRDDATAVARRALDLAHRQKERGNEAWVRRLLGEIGAHADPPDLESAQEDYGQALARAEELGMRPLAAHCHLGLGKLYRHTGKLEQAQEHLATTTAMYREMGMRYWREQAEAAIAAVG